jgi:hypothetical protein
MMTTARAQCWRSALPILLVAPSVPAQHLAQTLRPVTRAELCVTAGTLEPGALSGPVGVRSDQPDAGE